MRLSCWRECPPRRTRFQGLNAVQRRVQGRGGSEYPLAADEGIRYLVGLLKTQKLIPLLVIATGLFAYHNSFRDAFIFDDIDHIVDNPAIRQLGAAWQILTHSSRPVVSLSLAVNYALGGLNPWGYHLFNVCIHILAALTMYGVVRRTFGTEPLRAKWGGAAPWLAAVIACIWVAHPLQTESVTYIIQRGESLMGLFYLLTLYCVIRSSNSAHKVGWEAAAVASCVLGMGSKEVMITAPVVALLYDRAFLAGSWREIVKRRWGLYAGMAASWLLLPMLAGNGILEVPDWRQPTAGFGFKGIPPQLYALTQAGVIVHYLRLAFWPSRLCFDYGWGYGWPVAQTAMQVLPQMLVVVALLATTVWAWRRRPALGFLGVWFFCILALTSSVIPIADVAVEHRMYLPLAAVVTLAVAGVFLIGKRLAGARRMLGTVLGWVAGTAVVLPLSLLTIQRNADYRSEYSIWRDTVEKCPENPRAHNNLGLILLEEGNLKEARPQFEEALRLKPDYGTAHSNLGVVLSQSGQYPEAIKQLELAVQIKPDDGKMQYNLGALLLEAGRPQEAVVHLQEALRVYPQLAPAHFSLGLALDQAGRVQEAIGHYRQALRIMPDDAEAHYNLGVDLFQKGLAPEAIEHLEQAIRIKPDYAEAHSDLGIMLAQAGKVEEAMAHFQEALRIKPNDAVSQYNLGVVLAQAGKIQEAIQHLELALQIRPDYPEAHAALEQERSRASNAENQHRP